MILRFHKTFDKQYKNLSLAQKEKVKTTLLIFKIDMFNPALRNHPLKGEWYDHRSISAGGDLRIHYQEIDKNVILFVCIGSHSQLYK